MHTTEQLNAALAGRYVIDRLVGEGGMATVYLARDVRHNRKVALKVLKPDLGAVVGPDRFLAEIQVTANLQHPNLLPLFDSGAADGLLFYVMPYVEGESLRARIEREKQLPVEDAVRIAVSVASALDYAHRQGVIHRDLKPENILLHEGQPLVADFGIALAVSNAGGNRITQTGLSLGTPQYMSPEQATGDRAIDARTDIYSLGAVTYEMLTGEPPHMGSTSQAIIARVLTEKPRGIRASRPNVPAQVEGAVERALEKLPADRWATAKEFSEALTGARPVTMRTHEAASAPGAAGAGTTAVSRRLRPREAVMAGLAIVGISTSAWLAVRANRPQKPVLPAEFELRLPDSLAPTSNLGSAAALSLSLDGSVLVFQARRGPGETPALYLRRLDDRTVQRIRGTDSARGPVLSPDGGEMLFQRAGSFAIWRVSVRGGTARAIVDSANNQFSWGDAHRIVYRDGPSLWTRSEDGGPPTLLATPDSARHHAAYGWPEILPGGRAALITIWKGRRVLDSVSLGIVTIPGGKVTELPIRGSNPRYSAAAGHILYATSDGWIFAVPFSARSLQLLGPPVPVVEGVRVGTGGAAAFAVAENGTFAWLSGSVQVGIRTLVAVSRAGVARPLAAKPGLYSTPRVSPDGRRVAVTVAVTVGGPIASQPDVWLFDIKSAALTRLTTDSASLFPAWSTDGERIAYVRPRGDSVAMWRPIYAAGQPTPLVRSKFPIVEIAMGRPHGYAAIRVNGGVNGSMDIHVAPMDSLAPPRPLLNAPYNEFQPRISPDGRLIAYTTNKTSRNEVYVRPLMGDGPEVQVSTEGGTEPVWAPDGRELFYRGSSWMMSAHLTERPRLDVVRRDSLFRDVYDKNGPQPANYDVFPGGKELLMVALGSGAANDASVLTVVVNFRPGRRARSGGQEPQ
jgi:serine/threonine-protein kinase